MTELPPPTSEESAFERGFRQGFHFAAESQEWRRSTSQQQLADIAVTKAARVIKGRVQVRDIRSGLVGAGITGLLVIGTLLTAGHALGHDVTKVDVNCVSQQITITGVNFDVGTNSPVTVTGPGGYSQTFSISSSDWTQVIPVGQPGSYTADWPNSNGHSVTFTASCQRSEPTPTPVVTPTPAPTPASTPNPTPRITETPLATPTGSVVAATGTPKPTSELPQTDTAE